VQGAMETVTEKLCEEKHNAIKDKDRVTEKRLNAHAEEIGDIKAAVLKLTIMVDSIGKKSIFDKILITAVFMIGLVLLAIVLGPDISGKFVGGVLK
jgi:hypothetical protein